VRLRTVLRGLVTVAVGAVGSLVVVAQPAAAAPVYVTAPIYSLNSVRAGTPRAMAVLNASTANTMPMIQYTFNSSVPHNDYMVLELEPGGVVRIKPLHTFSNDGNPHNDKCLAILNNEPGWNQPIVNANCSYDSINNDVWYEDQYSDPLTGLAIYQYRSYAYNTCIVVQNASTANHARLITHTCGGGTNHYWSI
jgi:hypothetical protein